MEVTEKGDLKNDTNEVEGYTDEMRLTLSIKSKVPLVAPQILTGGIEGDSITLSKAEQGSFILKRTDRSEYLAKISQLRSLASTLVMQRKIEHAVAATRTNQLKQLAEVEKLSAELPQFVSRIKVRQPQVANALSRYQVITKRFEEVLRQLRTTRDSFELSQLAHDMRAALDSSGPSQSLKSDIDELQSDFRAKTKKFHVNLAIAERVCSAGSESAQLTPEEIVKLRSVCQNLPNLVDTYELEKTKMLTAFEHAEKMYQQEIAKQSRIAEQANAIASQ